MTEENAQQGTQYSMIDPFQVWKRVYFSFEDSLTKTIRDSVTTDNFANSLDWILNSYLQYLKLQKDFVSRYMDESPFPSKHDVARVAELVVSLENKVDRLEEELDEKLTCIEDQSSAVVARVDAQPTGMNTADFSRVFTPAMTAIKDMSKRINDLEKAFKKLDANLETMSRRQQAQALQRPPAPRAAKPAPPEKPDKSQGGDR
jgi:hypothetical protein